MINFRPPLICILFLLLLQSCGDSNKTQSSAPSKSSGLISQEDYRFWRGTLMYFYSPDAIPDKELLEELHQVFKPVIDEDISVTEHCSPFTLEDLIEFYYSEQPYKWLKENNLKLVDITHRANGRTSTHMDIKETDKLIYGRCKFTPTRYGRRVRDDGKKMRQSFRFHAANIKGISYRFPHQSKSPQLDILLESLKSKGEVLKDVDISYPVHPPGGFYSIGKDFLYKDLIWTFLSSGNDDDPEKLDQSYILIFYPKDK